ncbi:MAG TPA: hypothetical protein PKH77_23085 [Anaerolineae bacterium]|nr:hypothetical protein [Anaerolineae bacterium]
MTRRRSYTRHSSTRQKIRLRGAERILFILGATLYVVGLIGGLGLLPMPSATAILLLAVGGGLEMAVMGMLIF